MHAVGEPEEYCQYAVKNGISEIGFSDHFPMNYQPAFSDDISSIAMREEDIPIYFQMIDLNYKELTIKKAFEVDYFPKENLFFEKYLYLYDKLDYIIGSVHFIDELSIDQIDYKINIVNFGIEKLWISYFEMIKEMINNKRKYIDVIAHVDLPKRVVGDPPKKVSDKLQDMLKVIKSNELVVEVNTSGWDRQAKDLYPSASILKKIHDMGIEITLGSDAHHPSEVGRHFSKARSLLENIGFKRYITFNSHKKEYRDL